MKKENKEIEVPEGRFTVEIIQFQNSDKKILQSIYDNWLMISKSLLKLDARSMILPEGLSESAICLERSWYRLGKIKKSSSFKSSFDCYDPLTKKRIQIKATSVDEDLTSFGPKSVWDELYFLDFYRNGKWDGSYDCYLIDTTKLYSIILNKKKNETFKDQQNQNRRPRLSIKKEFIRRYHLKPIATYQIY